MELLKKTISQCLALRTRKTPGNTAIEYPGRTYTWEDVHRLSDYLAIRMMTMGISKGDPVGLWSVDTPNWILTFLALAKTGAVPVLIDTACRERELGDIIRSGGLRFLYYGDGCGCLVYESMADQLRREGWCRDVRWVPIGRDSTGRWMSDASFVSSEKSQIGHKRLNRRKNQVKPQDVAVILPASSGAGSAGPFGRMAPAWPPADSAVPSRGPDPARSSADSAVPSRGPDPARSSADGAVPPGEPDPVGPPGEDTGILTLTHWELVNAVPGTLEDGAEGRQDQGYLEVVRFPGLTILLKLLTSIHVGVTMDLSATPDAGSLSDSGQTVRFPDRTTY